MNKTEVVAEVQNKLCVSTREANEIVNTVFGVVADGLAKSGDVNITRFGHFAVKPGRAGKIKTPDGKVRSYKASKRVSFKAGSDLKNLVNGKKPAKKAAAKPAAKKPAKKAKK